MMTGVNFDRRRRLRYVDMQFHDKFFVSLRSTVSTISQEQCRPTASVERTFMDDD
jgi:hypothetical protein